MSRPEPKTIFSPAHKAALAQSRIGKKHSEETKQKIKESLKKRYEMRKKMAIQTETGEQR